MKNILKNEHRNLILLIIVQLTIGSSFNANAAKKANPVPIKPKQENSNLQQQDESKISKNSVKVFVKQVQIFGNVAKPQAIFIISATDPKVDGLKINRHFFDDIFRNVEKSSLKRVRKKEAKKNKDLIQW